VIQAWSTLVTSTKVAIVSTTMTGNTAITSAEGGTLGKWYQCGGVGWTGTGTCIAETTCQALNVWYSQCL
jgi:hypothetical protein